MPDKLPADIVALIDTVFTAFNSKNATLLSSVYGANVVIVDGFAPYRWSGPQAARRMVDRCKDMGRSW